MLTSFSNNSVPSAKPGYAQINLYSSPLQKTRTPGFFRNSSNYLTTTKAVKSSKPCTPRFKLGRKKVQLSRLSAILKGLSTHPQSLNQKL